MKYFSMFSGIGGFEIGIHNAVRATAERHLNDTQDMPDDTQYILQTGGLSATCIGYSEIDKYAIKVYERHFGNGRWDQGGGEQPTTEREQTIESELHTESEFSKTHNTGGHKNYGDATNINAAELPDFDLLVGGFPCQAFSVAGKRRGLEDARGTLFFDIARILEAKRPRHFVLENVKGLLSSRTIVSKETIIEELEKECVANIELNQHIPISEWETLTDNLSVYLRSTGGTSGLLKNFRYLQTQILQTIKRPNSSLIEEMQQSGLNVDEWVLLLEKSSSIGNTSSLDIPTLERMVAMNADVASWLKSNSGDPSSQKKSYTTSMETNQTTDRSTFMSVLTEMNITSFIMKQSLSSNSLWKKIESSSRKENTYYVKTFNIIVSELEKLRYCVEWQVLNSKDFGVPQNRERIFIVGHSGECSGRKVFPIGAGGQENTKPAKELREQHSNTLRTGYGNKHSNETYVGEIGHNVKIRRLTPTECMRLQGFPDDWCDIGSDGVAISDSQKYKMAGNAVTVNVVEAVMTGLIEL